MTKQAKRELLKAIRPRYLKASRTEKGRILDEFVAVTGYNRKYVIHLLHNGPPKRSTRKAGRRRRYGPDVIAALVRVGSKLRKKYDTAQTPYRRVLASPHVDEDTKQQLRQLYLTLNPVALQRQIEANLKQLWALER